MAKPTFVYVTYIKTTPEKIWEALTTPELNKRFWLGFHQESDWKVGSPWSIIGADGKVWDSGKILEANPPSQLVVSWQHQIRQELQAVGETRLTILLEPNGDVVKLTVTHEAPENGEAFIGAVSQGWPHILSSLKSMLETGEELPHSEH